MAKVGGLERPDVDEKLAANLYSKTDLSKALMDYYNDALPLCGFPEDHFWTNARILLNTLCVGFACYGQFGTKFPEDKPVLAMCVAMFFIMTGASTLLDYFVLKQAVMYVKLGQESVFLDLDMGGDGSGLTLSLRAGERIESCQTDVSKYFDYDGKLCQENVFKDFADLLNRWQQPGKESKKGK